MGQIVPQMNEGRRQPVDEYRLMSSARTRCPPSGAAARCVTPAFHSGLPLPCQLLNQRGQMTPRDPGEPAMRKN